MTKQQEILADQITLLAAASAASSAVIDLIEAARDGEITGVGNVGSGETVVALADAVRLLLDVTGADDDETQLHGAVVRFLDSRT